MISHFLVGNMTGESEPGLHMVRVFNRCVNWKGGKGVKLVCKGGIWEDTRIFRMGKKGWEDDGKVNE